MIDVELRSEFFIHAIKNLHLLIHEKFVEFN